VMSKFDLMDRIPPTSTILKEQRPSGPTLALKLGYRPELDCLRGISILLVYIHHLYYPLMPGGFLVRYFLVLSGFLLRLYWLRNGNERAQLISKTLYSLAPFNVGCIYPSSWS
jgi:hypothetical protein